MSTARDTIGKQTARLRTRRWWAAVVASVVSAAVVIAVLVPWTAQAAVSGGTESAPAHHTGSLAAGCDGDWVATLTFRKCRR